jgi:hypothetical protein
MQALARKGADVGKTITVLLKERNRSLFGDEPRRGKPPGKAKKPRPLAESSAVRWHREHLVKEAERLYWVARLLGGKA